MIDGIDYGPLEQLIGTWKGDDGLDIAPEEDGGDERNEFYETITFEPGRDLDNAEEQELVVVRYQQVVHRKRDDKLIHNQVGFWLWDAENQSVIECFAIPRGVSVVAVGNAVASGDETIFTVKAEGSDIAEAPFMAAKASTTAFEHSMTVSGDEMSYKQTTYVDIYGHKNYEHVDTSRLTRVK